MTILFNSQITDETVEDLVNKIENTHDSEITIYITSEGGYVYMSRILSDYLSRVARERTLTIVASGYVDSCALEVLVDLNNDYYPRVVVLEGTTSTIHMYSANVDYGQLTNARSQVPTKVKSLDRLNNTLATKLNLDENQKIKFFAGEEIYLDTPDIAKILSK
jgi:ATP-dependent protease ClpP protease subunit